MRFTVSCYEIQMNQTMAHKALSGVMPRLQPVDTTCWLDFGYDHAMQGYFLDVQVDAAQADDDGECSNMHAITYSVGPFPGASQVCRSTIIDVFARLADVTHDPLLDRALHAICLDVPF